MNKKIKTVFISSLIVGLLGLITTSGVACSSSIKSKQENEIYPTIKGYDQHDFSKILASEFIKIIKTNIQFLAPNKDIKYELYDARLNELDEDVIDLIIRYHFKGQTHTYKKILKGFKNAKQYRLFLENKKYLEDEKNHNTLYLMPIVNSSINISKTTVDEALKWQNSYLNINNSNNDLKYEILKITKSKTANSIDIEIKISKGNGENLASITYNKTLNGFISEADKKIYLANLEAIKQDKNQLEPQLIDEKTKQKTIKEVIENYKTLFKLPFQTGFIYEIQSVEPDVNNKIAVVFKILIKKGNGSQEAVLEYLKTIKGFNQNK